jgi:hypothetical protein
MTEGADIKKIYAFFNGSAKSSLPELCLALLAQQKTAWPQLRDGYAGLMSLKERIIREGDLTVALQCNPQRSKSTGADVDPDAIKARPCFLCGENRPEVQQAILYRRKFLVLCNPWPIFPWHFTISHIEHIAQSLIRALPAFLQLAKDFHPGFVLLYNGPECGASAPDHLHFQAVPKAAIPILKDRFDAGKKPLRKTGGVFLFQTESGERSAMIVAGADKKELVAFLRRIFRAMKNVLHLSDEPMMNLFCLYEKGKWRVVIFPRLKHRPDAYYQSGDDRILVSPGAVDMGGVLVLPREQDFYRLEAAAIRKLFREVSLPEEKLEEIVAVI